MNLLPHIERFLVDDAGIEPGDGVVVAFSGGGDSTILLWSLAQLAERLRLRLVAAHLDHNSDPDSSDRCEKAAGVAAEIGVAFESGLAAGQIDPQRNGLEASLRRLRYRFLSDARHRHGSRFVATAHHRDDQAETVLLRMQFGSGPLGLAGIRDRDGQTLRPLLPFTRLELMQAAREVGLTWVEDPTNRDLTRPRNRLRHATLPALELGVADLRPRLDRLATQAGRAREATRDRLHTALRPIVVRDGASVVLSTLAGLPDALLGPAMALLQDLAGAEYPPPAKAVEELRRQIGAGHGIGCDCGAFWRWEGCEGRIHIGRRRTNAPVFPYTLKLSGGRAHASSAG
ncbi:MAG: tRNA lysidine(34) synthetase TilS [Acidobacteriota bacterium]|nr:tRNA lysidine(34) synthetase TilS [Acidobacteriota bacterium]